MIQFLSSMNTEEKIYNESQVKELVQVCLYIFESAVYHSVSEERLSSELERSGLKKEYAEMMGNVWREKGKKVEERLKEKRIGGNELQNVDWRLQLKMGQYDLYKMQEMEAVFHFSTTEEVFAVACNEKELFELYAKLEKVQEQLDALT